MNLIRLVARPMLASTFVWGGIHALKNANALAEAAHPVNEEIRDFAGKVAPQVPVPADDATLVRVNAGVQILAGLGLATGKAPRLSSMALAASVVPTTVAGHPFWQEKDKAKRAQQMTHFFKNVSMLGGLVIAAIDTEGRPGVAWRAQHAVGTAKREAKHLRREAKQQAKLARKSVTS
ncbi:MAG: DoxX family membrane protein [Nocardioidaceae bacterium]